MPLGASAIALASNTDDDKNNSNNNLFHVIFGHERYTFRAASEDDAVSIS